MQLQEKLEWVPSKSEVGRRRCVVFPWRTFDLEEVRGFLSESKAFKGTKTGLQYLILDSLLFVSQFKSFVHSWSQDLSLYSVLGEYAFKKTGSNPLSNCRFTVTTG